MGNLNVNCNVHLQIDLTTGIHKGSCNNNCNEYTWSIHPIMNSQWCCHEGAFAHRNPQHLFGSRIPLQLSKVTIPLHTGNHGGIWIHHDDLEKRDGRNCEAESW